LYRAFLQESALGQEWRKFKQSCKA